MHQAVSVAQSLQGLSIYQIDQTIFCDNTHAMPKNCHVIYFIR